MPKKCIHLEKVEKIIRELEISHGTSCCSGDKHLFYVRVKGGREGGSYGSTPDTGWLPNGIVGTGTNGLEGCLNYLKKEVIHIIEQCNCENENNQQLVLRRNVETERNDLQVTKINLESRVSDLQSSNWSLQSANTSLSNQLEQRNKDIVQKDKDIEWGKGQLVIKEKEKEQLKTERDDYKNKWIVDVKRITDSFNALQLEKTKKETKITSLQEELEGSQNIDLRYRERKLDELVRNLGFNRERIDNLRSAHERLKRASDPENYNQEAITNAQSEIDNIKRELFQTNINVDDLHKVYKVCEKVAELRVKQEKIRQQQYQTHQEQPTNN